MPDLNLTWAETGDGHFYVRKIDTMDTGNAYERRLHVSSALPTGLHIDIEVEGIGDNQGSAHAGINLTPLEAVELITHVAKVLGHGTWPDVLLRR